MTNPLHYPDLERCKKLTEIGFPMGEHTWGRTYWQAHGNKREPDEDKFFQIYMYGMQHTNGPMTTYCCPSVMEMLDVIPSSIDEYKRSPLFSMGKDWCKYESYAPEDPIVKDQQIEIFNNSLPNALADLILWLHENKYITFKPL